MLRADDPNYCRALIEDGLAQTRKKLSSMRQMVEKYHGPYWDDAGSSAGGRSYSPENVYFEYLSAMISRLVHQNPRIKVNTRRTGPQEEVAQALEHGLNRLVADLDLAVLLRDLAVDMLFAWGVAMVKEAPRSGMILAEEDPVYPSKPTWPVVERIPQMKFFIDPEAYELEDTRFRGHEWRMDKDDLIKRAEENPDEGWDLEAIRELATDIKQEYEDQGADRGGSTRTYRDQVYCYDVWFPEITLDDSPGPEQGFYGTIYTLAISQSKRTGVNFDGEGGLDSTKKEHGFVRKPRPFFGPRTGPYTVFGAYRVPNSPYPLSPLMACEGQILDLNDHAIAASRSMQNHKRLIAVRDASTAEKVKNQLHDYVISVPFDSGRAEIEEVELAGHTDKQIEYLMMIKERSDRVLGMDETMRGNATGIGTATEHTLANEAASARISEIQESWTRGVIDVCMGFAHYMYYSDTIIFPLGEEVFEEAEIEIPDYPGLEVQPWFRGGDPDPDSGYTIEDLELEIEPYSMARTNEGLAQQRALQTHELLMNTLPLIGQFPDFPWKEHFQRIGEAMNMEYLEGLITKDMLDRLTKQLQMMTQQQANPQMAAPQGGRTATHVGGPAAQQGGASQGQGPATGARALGTGMMGQKQTAKAR